MKIKNATIILAFSGLSMLLSACGSAANSGGTVDSAGACENNVRHKVEFDADSAYSYVKRQVSFGPRVPNSDAHCKTGDWLVAELRRHGADVIEQTSVVKAFDGTRLNMRNIIGQFNAEAKERVLLLAHWDCRPWADNDPDESKRKLPVDGANDGASGVGVLLEVARALGSNNPTRGVDIAFVDDEDWGVTDNDESWCLGSRYLANNPIKSGWCPSEVILLDMVGGVGAEFRPEYISVTNAGSLVEKIWACAAKSGYANWFVNEPAGAITDDHVEFIKVGIPAINIIELGDSGFNERWHTTHDNMDGIDVNTLKAVGQTVLNYLL